MTSERIDFVYTVWFEDDGVPWDDQHREWPACFVVTSANEDLAKTWGDHLAVRYAAANKLRILSSRVEHRRDSSLPGLDALPVILNGQEATDREIGL